MFNRPNSSLARVAGNNREAKFMKGEYCSRLCALKGFAARPEHASLRLRRYTGRNALYAQATR